MSDAIKVNTELGIITLRLRGDVAPTTAPPAGLAGREVAVSATVCGRLLGPVRPSSVQAWRLCPLPAQGESPGGGCRGERPVAAGSAAVAEGAGAGAVCMSGGV